MKLEDVGWTAFWTVAFEGVTLLGRFGLGLQSTRDTSWLKHWTFGLRIHHAYFGLLMVLVAVGRGHKDWWGDWLLRIGLALVLSDLIHHFLVLWPITGSPEFDIVYPPDTWPDE